MKILVAEDDAESRALLEDILGGVAEWQVTGVADGAAAWEALQSEEPYGLAVLDVMMPQLGGLEVAERVRRDPRLARLPMVLCTALHDRSTVTQAAALEITHYIRKPFAAEVVVAKVRGAVASRRHTIDLDSDEIVCPRLRITAGERRKLVGKLAGSIVRWTYDVHHAVRGDQVGGLASSAGELKRACATLGIPEVARLLASAEKALETIPDVLLDRALFDPILLNELARIAEGVRGGIDRLNQELIERS